MLDFTAETRVKIPASDNEF